MTIYLDSIEFYNSINNEPEPEPTIQTTKPKKKNNDRAIGILTIIGLILYAGYAIARWLMI